MKVRLIGPNDEFEYDWTFDGKPPAVIISLDRVWVQSAYSTTGGVMYFEQMGWHPVLSGELKKVK